MKLAPTSKKLLGIENLFYGIALGVLPGVWLLLMFKRTIEIANSPVAAWWVELWVLLGAAWLLFYKSGSKQSRAVVEWSTFIAAAAIFITKAILGNH